MLPRMNSATGSLSTGAQGENTGAEQRDHSERRAGGAMGEGAGTGVHWRGGTAQHGGPFRYSQRKVNLVRHMLVQERQGSRDSLCCCRLSTGPLSLLQSACAAPTTRPVVSSGRISQWCCATRSAPLCLRLHPLLHPLCVKSGACAQLPWSAPELPCSGLTVAGFIVGSIQSYHTGLPSGNICF